MFVLERGAEIGFRRRARFDVTDEPIETAHAVMSGETGLLQSCAFGGSASGLLR